MFLPYNNMRKLPPEVPAAGAVNTQPELLPPLVLLAPAYHVAPLLVAVLLLMVR